MAWAAVKKGRRPGIGFSDRRIFLFWSRLVGRYCPAESSMAPRTPSPPGGPSTRSFPLPPLLPKDNKSKSRYKTMTRQRPQKGDTETKRGERKKARARRNEKRHGELREKARIERRRLYIEQGIRVEIKREKKRSVEEMIERNEETKNNQSYEFLSLSHFVSLGPKTSLGFPSSLEPVSLPRRRRRPP